MPHSEDGRGERAKEFLSLTTSLGSEPINPMHALPLDFLLHKIINVLILATFREVFLLHAAKNTTTDKESSSSMGN